MSEPTPLPVSPTPIMTDHAREQCASMGISTKVAKAIYRNAELSRPCFGLLLATCEAHPRYAVLYKETPRDQPDVVVTVLFREAEKYVRSGRSYRVVQREEAP